MFSSEHAAQVWPQLPTRHSGDALSERVAVCISYSAAMISANEKSRIVTLLMRAGWEVGTKFDDEYWTGVHTEYSIYWPEGHDQIV